VGIGSGNGCEYGKCSGGRLSRRELRVRRTPLISDGDLNGTMKDVQKGNEKITEEVIMKRKFGRVIHESFHMGIL
jgi:hypothetical protein